MKQLFLFACMLALCAAADIPYKACDPNNNNTAAIKATDVCINWFDGCNDFWRRKANDTYWVCTIKTCAVPVTPYCRWPNSTAILKNDTTPMEAGAYITSKWELITNFFKAAFKAMYGDSVHIQTSLITLAMTTAWLCY